MLVPYSVQDFIYLFIYVLKEQSQTLRQELEDEHSFYDIIFKTLMEAKSESALYQQLDSWGFEPSSGCHMHMCPQARHLTPQLCQWCVNGYDKLRMC